jgi:hypothetical protein
MDFDSYFRNKIESVLITASWVEAVSTMLGINGVSQVWGDKPEWYFWIDGAPGAYSLLFESGVQIEYGGQDLVQGQFVLKCFPGFESDVFETLSPQEQELRLSRRFDATGTPRLEDRADIPEAYFTVGSISLMLNGPESAAGISFDSLDRIRWKAADDAEGQPAINENDRDNRVVRRLSGWRIGYPFFDCLIGLYAYYTKHPPVYWAATQSPGFECIFDPVDGMQSRRCDNSRLWSGSVLFCAPAGTAEAVDYLWRSHLDSTEKIVFEQYFNDSEGQAPASPGDLQMPVNPLWRELAHSDLKSDLSSTCGCGDHEHHFS